MPYAASYAPRMPTRTAATLIICWVATSTLLLDVAEAKPTNAVAQAEKPFTFPAAVGPFHRTQLHNFTRDGLDRSASYQSTTGLMTAYVYPVRPPYARSLPAHFAQVEKEIRALWTNLRVVSKTSTSVTHNGRTYPGMEETFTARPRSENVELVSRVAVFTLGDRYVVFRFSAPKRAGFEAAAQIRLFLDRFPWPQ
jgi:hypothetical protein